jgi:hypothetical protein
MDHRQILQPRYISNSDITNADIGVTSTVGQAPTSHWQVQIQLLRPVLPTILGSQFLLFAKIFCTPELSSIGKANAAKKSMPLINKELGSFQEWSRYWGI